MAPSREDNKRQVSDALVESAWRLFTKHGFEATTVDAIVEAAGCSRRTFFRYFPTKVAVVFPWRERRLDAFAGALERGLVAQPPLAAVRDACLQMGQNYSDHAKRELARQRLVDASPALVATELKIYEQWEKTIADAVTPRRPSDKRQRQARIFAAATVGVLRTTLREWYDSDCEKNLVRLGRAAFDLLESGFSTDAMP